MGDSFLRRFQFIALLIWCFIALYPRADGYSLVNCEGGDELRLKSGLKTAVCGLVWRDQNKEQIQNVFKRFLFHYSKAQNSVGSVQRESHSVHPLMRLSSKLSQRRKKHQLVTISSAVLGDELDDRKGKTCSTL